MGDALQTFLTGPRTFVPAERIEGGQVVEARAAGRVGVAGAGSLKTLGIAVTSGVRPEDVNSQGVVDANGNHVLDASVMRRVVSVAYGGIELDGVLHIAAAAFGDRLKAADDGAVTPMIQGDDHRLEVGTCLVPTGVAAGARGAVRTR